MSIIIIVIINIICLRRDQGRHASRGRDVQQSLLPSFVGELELCVLSEINVTAVVSQLLDCIVHCLSRLFLDCIVHCLSRLLLDCIVHCLSRFLFHFVLHHHCARTSSEADVQNIPSCILVEVFSDNRLVLEAACCASHTNPSLSYTG